MRLCLVVPHYDHVAQFRRLLPSLLGTNLPIVIVDDASPGQAAAELERILEDSGSEFTLVRHEENQGKGGAVTTGLFTAFEAGYMHALQIAEPTRPGHAQLSLTRTIRAQLLARGIPEAHVHAIDLCTFDEAEHLFSYRRDGPRTGRHALVAGWRD